MSRHETDPETITGTIPRHPCPDCQDPAGLGHSTVHCLMEQVRSLRERIEILELKLKTREPIGETIPLQEKGPSSTRPAGMGEDPCGVACSVQGDAFGSLCTRIEGHEGPHIAHGYDYNTLMPSILAAWI